jgi:hypothetical protein
MSRRLGLVCLMLAAMLVPAAPAAADDASVYAAWSSRDAEAAEQYRKWERALKRWARSNLRVWRPLYKALGVTT